MFVQLNPLGKHGGKNFSKRKPIRQMYKAKQAGLWVLEEKWSNVDSEGPVTGSTEESVQGDRTRERYQTGFNSGGDRKT